MKIMTGRLFRRPVFRSMEIVDDWPPVFDHSIVYIQIDDTGPWAAAFVCPCGCEQVIYLNLIESVRPSWRVEAKWFRGISVSPSVWRKVGCKSHFFIRDGNIQWAKI